ncbi:MAG TPA: SRPBCC family protein [Rudaea sp.]|nr:SRPBCC family protein [Rudaea sp.]
MQRLFMLAALAWSTAAMPATPASRTGSFRLDAAPARVFPFFTAEGERAWAPGWEPEMLSGDVERGSVFRTRNHDKVVTWIVTDYEPAAWRVSYARLVEGSNMGLVDVSCAPDGRGTRVTVRYTLTPIAADGDAAVAHLLDAARYADFMQEWQTAITAALAHDAPRGEP